ncbi:MAG: DUF6164 family protein [Reinekea forsetii]|jgi:hypothetical protein|uniref:DUF2007 domain-containing protein n=1 Tax=Reinekea forsetii TaxID=1336806 RepID=A0A2K8KM88_9GAMM|nr:MULTISPECIES: DUF6164 family protein [Reinekea]ATX75970.1 hypothetical protein REIFOR_00802 [Reinekea forsetii]MDO7640465.1 DUF6164 family protein [Reinekea forsetii]MDO7645710.1 DUF6164 family protein [Reinekea forsetii]MDO7673767.1 DUF6164 family protein [Reinekea forsetii]
MAKLAFRLNNVPVEEADLVRSLLVDQEIDFYETTAGRWGISVAAIWVKTDEEFTRARELIEQFQVGHSRAMRDQYTEDVNAGRVPTLWQLLRASPVIFITYWLLIGAVVVISVLPIYGYFN